MCSEGSDVAAVWALEKPMRDLLAVAETAGKALERLEAAKYPGAEWLAYQLRQALDETTEGSLAAVLTALEMFKGANGDQAAADFEFYSKYLRLSVAQASREMLDNLGIDWPALDRVKGMQSYASTVA